jgi:two-component system nitrate/nitrite response regulator NarL
MGFLARPAFITERFEESLSCLIRFVGCMGAALGHLGPGGLAEPQIGGTTNNALTSTPQEPKVLIADDQVPARAGIRRAIEPHGLRVVAEAANAEEALQMSLAQRPDVCILNVELPGSGIEAARAIKQSLPETKIVMMTGSAQGEDLFEALRAGADGYLTMSTPVGRLAYAIIGVMRGEAALPRAMTGRLVLEFRERGARRRVTLPSGEAEVEFTAREFEVLQRLRKHERTAEIAVHLGISQVTVRRHVASLLRKLGVPNRRRAIEMLEQAEQSERQRAGAE